MYEDKDDKVLYLLSLFMQPALWSASSRRRLQGYANFSDLLTFISIRHVIHLPASHSKKKA